MAKETLMTLIYPINKTRVLMGMKKLRIGKGYYVGFGGRVKDKENIKSCAIREIKEECGLKALEKDLKPVGLLTVHNPKYPLLGTFHIHLFTLASWQGEPTETDEVSPRFFPQNKIPWQKIRESDQYWLPAILNGRSVYAELWYNLDETLEKIKVKIN